MPIFFNISFSYSFPSFPFHPTGDLIIIGHDYTVQAPEDPAAATLHWKTSGGKPVACQDALGNIWSACVDVRRAGDAAITKRLIPERQAQDQPKGKGKGKAEESEDEEDDDEGEEEVQEVLPARSSRRLKPAPVEEEDGEEDEPEEEPASKKGKSKPPAKATTKPAAKPAPKPAPKPPTKPAAKPAPPVTRAKKTAARKRKAPSGENSDEFFDDDDDDPEEEDETSPPPAKKLRSAGPPTPFPPPPPRNAPQRSLSTQEGGGRSSKTPRGSANLKHVTFTPEGTSSNANDPAVVAERRRLISTIPLPERQPESDGEGPSSRAPAAHRRRNGGTGGREFLVPKASAAAPPASAAAPPAPPPEIAGLLGQLANISPNDLSALLSYVKSQNAPLPA